MGKASDAEELHCKNKQLEQELARLEEILVKKEEAHELHLRAYQDTHERQEEQLTLLEMRVSAHGCHGLYIGRGEA